MTLPKPYPRQARFTINTQDDPKGVKAMREAKRDPADLVQRVAKYKLWLERKRAGRLEPYVGTLRRER